MVNKDPKINIQAIGAVVKRIFNCTPSYKKLWAAKQKAMARIFGGWDTSYQELPKWMRALQNFNQGSCVKFVTKEGSVPDSVEFDYVFWTFGPSVEGFKHCRPVISIDGTHLYGKYEGKMLIATAVDGNNQLFPLAFAIVDKECTASWKWFLTCIRQYVTKRQGICLISDRHASIKAAMGNDNPWWRPPYAYHVYCLRHVISNFNKEINDAKLKKMATRAGMQ